MRGGLALRHEPPAGSRGRSRREVHAAVLVIALCVAGCSQDATVRSITLRLDGEGLLDEVDRITLNVFDAAGLSCRDNGELDGAPAAGAIVEDLSLTLGEQTSVDVPAGRRAFVVDAFAADERIGVGCVIEDLEGGQTVEIDITVHRLVFAGECGNGRLDDDEQCEDGNATPGDGCDAACESEEGSLPQSTNGSQVDPVAASAADGFFAIAWFDRNDDLGKPIRVTFRDRDGAALEGGLGNDRDANSVARGDPNAPAVATSAGGSVVVWEDFSGPGEDVPDIKARFFAPDTRPRDSSHDLQVNAATGGSQSDPAAGMVASGAALLVWTDESLSPPGIVGRRFDAGGEPTDPEDLVVSNETDSSEPAVAGLGADFAVAYRAGGIKLRMVPVAGDPEAETALDASAGAHAPAIASLADGSAALVVWAEGDAVIGQVVDDGGQPASDPIEISPEGLSAALPRVSGGDGIFAVVWESDEDIHGRLFDAGGEPAFNRVSDGATSFEVNRVTDGEQLSGAVAIIGDLMLAVWQDNVVRPDEDDQPAGIRFRFFSVEGI